MPPGLVGQMRPNRTMTRMSRYGIELYAGLEAETGLATGWKQCGSVNVASTPERLVALKRTFANAKSFGVEAEFISPAEAGKLWPLMRTDDLTGAVWIPGDGKANPTDLTQSLAKGARSGGARLVEGVKVTGFDIRNGRVAGVRTDEGTIACEIVVNCGGQWARTVGKLAGVNVPLFSAEHFYIVTRKIPGVTPDLPVMRDPDGFIYYKEEVGGLVMGGFEPKAKPWGVEGIPEKFEFQLLPEDWDQFEPLMRAALHRTPVLETTEVRQLLNGPESFTPDGNFILGEAPERRGLLRRRGVQLGGHRQCRRRRAAHRGMDRRRRAQRRSLGPRHPPLRRLPRQPPLPCRAHGRDAGPPLCHALAASRARLGASAAPLAAL